MSEQAHAAIDSLTTSVASLQAQVRAITSQIEGKAAATARSELTSSVTAQGAAVTPLTNRVTSCEPAELCIDIAQTVEPLRMGKVTFYGESARQIRAAQEVLHAAGVGQLEVVKRANESGEPFVVIDGQVFIAKSNIESAIVDTDRFVVRTAVTDQGRHVAAGIGAGVQTCSDLSLGSQLADGIRNLLRDELRPGGMLYRPTDQRSN